MSNILARVEKRRGPKPDPRLGSIAYSRLVSQFPRMSILFLDLDGTVRRSNAPSGFINKPEEIEMIPEALREMERWKRANWYLVAVSNQGGVGDGYLSYADALTIEKSTYRLANWVPSVEPVQKLSNKQNYAVSYLFDDMLMAIGPTDDASNMLRKPNPGMLFCGAQNLIRKMGAGVVRLEDCVMVGDRPEDRECAERAGVTFLAAEAWRAGEGGEIKRWLKRPAENLAAMRKLKEELGL